MKFFSALVTCLGLLLIFSCQPTETDTGYRISGKLTEVTDENPLVILSSYNPIIQVEIPLDTASVASDGTYSLEYNFPQPDLYRLNLPGKISTLLAIDEGQNNIVVNAQAKRGGKIEITGSEDSDKLIAYEAFRKASNKRLVSPAYERMSEAGKAGDVEKEVAAVMEYSEKSRLHRKELIDFTEETIGSSIALYGSVLRWTGDDEVSRLESIVSAFEKARPNLEMTRQMREKLERFKSVAIGASAPAIRGKDEKGNEVNLAQSLKKYTLIDFWASWCGPCISQLPDLRQAYDEYSDQGFEIVSVSVDRSEEKWLAAIDRLNIDWKHISDVKGWQSDLAKAYNVTFVPFNFLLDENGTIIHKNLHSKELQNTLKVLFEAERTGT